MDTLKEGVMKTLIFIIFVFLLSGACLNANPFPVYPQADMTYEELNIVIEKSTDTLHATFSGEYLFTYIDPLVLEFFFPVPPDTHNIHVWQESLEIPWEWHWDWHFDSSVWEQTFIPVFKWEGPFPTSGTLYRVEYEHYLIRREYYMDPPPEGDYICIYDDVPEGVEEYLFYYPFATGSTSYVPTEVVIDLLFPDEYQVSDVLLIYNFHCFSIDYQILGHHLLIHSDSVFHSTLIVALAKKGTAAKTPWNWYE